ncbi:hypothetical protein ABIA35_005993 [Catenulispora sp. MAP12-49]|uniref:hypothetical protein n=1 Tax=Catenulispora sp. MAP12-49 TaxID=3156302 RepID=UPI00351236BD
MTTTTFTHWAAANAPWSYIGASVTAMLGLALLLVTALMGRNAIRATGRERRISALINVAGLLATSVQATGMWKFFSHTMGLPVGFRVVLFAFMEIALLACALRARDNVEKGNDAGIDWFLVVALALASGVMSSTDAASAQEVLMRVLVSLVVALLWTRDLMAAKKKARAAGGRRSGPVRWRITPERIFVALRLADAVDTTVQGVEAGRRVSRYLRATDRAARSWRRPWLPDARADRARMRLTTHALMHGDPSAVHEQLADSAFNDALKRLGIGATQTPQNRPVLNVLSPFTRPFPPQASPFSAPVNTLPSPQPADPVQQARELQRQGLSYQQIGDRLGRSKTWAFNAVNGQAPASVNGHGG